MNLSKGLQYQYQQPLKASQSSEVWLLYGSLSSLFLFLFVCVFVCVCVVFVYVLPVQTQLTFVRSYICVYVAAPAD
jgi:hypothetical protein